MRKKTVNILLMVILGIFVVLFLINDSAQALSGKEIRIEKRLQNAREQLVEIAKKPYEQSVAIVSFKDFKSKEFVADFLANNPEIKVRQVFYAYAGPYYTSIGGFFVEEEGLTKDALSKLEQELISWVKKFRVDFMKERLMEESHLLKTNSHILLIQPGKKLSKEKEGIKEGDKVDVKVTRIINTQQQEIVENTKKALINAQHRLESLKKDGIQIIGLEIVALNKTLIKISNNIDVRAVEIVNTQKGRTIPPMLPTR